MELNLSTCTFSAIVIVSRKWSNSSYSILFTGQILRFFAAIIVWTSIVVVYLLLGAVVLLCYFKVWETILPRDSIWKFLLWFGRLFSKAN